MKTSLLEKLGHWVDGWVDVGAGLRIAYGNKKYGLERGGAGVCAKSNLCGAQIRESILSSRRRLQSTRMSQLQAFIASSKHLQLSANKNELRIYFVAYFQNFIRLCGLNISHFKQVVTEQAKKSLLFVISL